MARWIDQNVVGDDVFPHRWPQELEKSFKALHDALCFCDSTVAEMDEDLGRIYYRVLSGHRLTREEFHLMMALNPGIFNFTNKFFGLSDFDDYEVFDHFCYEGEPTPVKRYYCGYIDPVRSPPPPTARTITPGAWGPYLAPEDIFWNRLRPEQREFFARHFPKVAIRFKRDGG
jgi:hypothetical protein